MTTEAPLHPSQESLLRFFEFEHLPEDLKPISAAFFDLACKLKGFVGEGTVAGDAELTTALRKLLEAKDCAVRAALGAR